MCIFFLIVARDVSNSLLCFLAFSRVLFLWMFHFREGTRWMPRYVYGSFCVRIGKDCEAYMYSYKFLHSLIRETGEL